VSQLNDSDIASPSLAAALRLAMVPGVGPRTRTKLLERFGSPEAVLKAAPSDLRTVSRIGAKVCQAICCAQEEIDAEAELELCRSSQIDVVIDSDERYPRPLRDLPDPPGVLFVRGTLAPSDAMAVAIVGSRHATHYGLTQAERLAGSLARAGLTVVSGLARGIDAAAHRGALAAGGRTIAALS
jgi:DNA processing protein